MVQIFLKYMSEIRSNNPSQSSVMDVSKSVNVNVCVCVCALQAGASSMWASCCGLLNEVMGTGTVRAQQPGFGAGAGPFRFAPSAGYSTYPPTASGSAGQLCKACGLAFSVFRRKVSGREDMPGGVVWYQMIAVSHSKM